MSVRRAEVLLAAVIIARSTSFVFNKIGLGTMSAFNMLAVRFLLAFVLLAALFEKKLIKGLNRRAIAGGALVGFLFFLVMSCEMLALKTVNAGTVSLLENLAIIIVPLLESALHRRAPSAMSLLCAAIAVGGVALLTLEGGSFRLGAGECIALLAAFLYAAGIIAIDRTSHKADGFELGVLEVGFLGLFALLAACPRRAASGASSWSWRWCVPALAIPCSPWPRAISAQIGPACSAP